MKTSRKPYSCPEIDVMVVQTDLMATSSAIQGSEDNKVVIDYGGVDSEGSKTPGSRQYDFWDGDE